MKSKLTLCLVLSYVFISTASATEVAQVTRQELATKVVLNGSVEAVTEATVSAQINAEVKAIHVDVDDKVTTGNLLLELDDTELLAQLAKANASLEVALAQFQQALSEHQRLQGLEQDSFVSANDMTRAESAVEVARANISLAKAEIAAVKQLLTYTKVIAPYSGVVTTRHSEVGETVVIGQPLLSGFALNQNRLSVQVPSALIVDVERRQAIFAQTSSGRWLELNSLTIAPTANANTHAIMVRANVDKNIFKQRPGSFIKVAIDTAPRVALTVPDTAVFRQGDLTAVYVQLGEKFVLRQVIVGEKISQRIEILSGLQEGDIVVLESAKYLSRHNSLLRQR